MEQIPNRIFEGLDEIDYETRARRVGRFLVLQEMGFFELETNISLAIKDKPGSFEGRVRKQFSNKFGDVAGCHPADLEVCAQMLGVYDEVYDVRET